MFDHLDFVTEGLVALTTCRSLVVRHRIRDGVRSTLAKRGGFRPLAWKLDVRGLRDDLRRDTR